MRDRQSDKALKHITETLTINEKIGLQRFNAELLRLKGEVFLDKGLLAEAQQCFRQAINTSKQQGVKLLELRATKSLSQFLAEQGKVDEAKSMLSEIYGWFTEGFDTLDLLEVKELLDAF